MRLRKMSYQDKKVVGDRFGENHFCAGFLFLNSGADYVRCGSLPAEQQIPLYFEKYGLVIDSDTSWGLIGR